MTNIPLEEPETRQETEEVPVPNCDLAQTTAATESVDHATLEETAEEPVSEHSNEPITSSLQPSTSFDVVQFIHKLSPIPDAAAKRSVARKRKSGRSEILTSSPYKTAVEEKENDKKLKERKKEIRNTFKGKLTKGLNVKRKRCT